MSSNTPQTAAHDKLETLRSRYVGTGHSEISQQYVYHLELSLSLLLPLEM